MKLFLKSIILSGLLCASISQAGPTKIRLLSWWDYISPEVIQKLERAGYKIDLSSYKSSEVAFSRLISKNSDFDVVILSGTIIDSLRSITPFENISRIEQRDYLKFVRRDDIGCVPYLWSATVFSVIGNEQVDSLDQLLALKKRGFSIALVDDPFEIIGRQLIDKSCQFDRNQTIDWTRSQNCLTHLSFSPELKGSDFKTSTAEYLTKPQTASYGWHGEVAPALAKRNFNINISLPKIHPIIGADYVCVLKKKKQNARVIEFARLLSDHESTGLNMKATGYFSPYAGQTSHLDPKIQKIYQDVLNLPETNKPLVLTTPPSEIHQRLNQVWQKIRYEKK